MSSQERSAAARVAAAVSAFQWTNGFSAPKPPQAASKEGLRKLPHQNYSDLCIAPSPHPWMSPSIFCGGRLSLHLSAGVKGRGISDQVLQHMRVSPSQSASWAVTAALGKQMIPWEWVARCAHVPQHCCSWPVPAQAAVLCFYRI